MSKPLKTLFQHNNEMSATYMAASNACLNGIECPMCGTEMWDTNPTMVLTVNPPRKQIHCNNCPFEGTRIA